MSIKKSLAWMGVAQTVAFCAQFASSIVLARYLSAQEMGIFAVGVAVVAVLAILQQLGLTALIVREEVLSVEVRTTAFTVNAAIAVALSLTTCGAALLGARFLSDVGVRDVLFVLALSPLFGIPAFLPGAMLEREGQFRNLGAISSVVAIVGAAVTVGLAMAGYRYMSLAYASVVGSACQAGLLIAFGRRHFSIRLGFQSWTRVLHFGSQMLFVSGVSTIAARANEILLGRLLGLSALGLFNRASGLNAMVWSNVHSLISRVVLVDFSEINRAGHPLRDRYLRAVAIITALLWPAFAGLAVVAKPFIITVYGVKWLTAAAPLGWLAMSSIILVSMAMTWELFTATGNLLAQTRIEIIRAPVSVALFVGGCFISIEAAAFSRVIDASIAIALYRPHVQRMTQTSLSDLKPIYLQSAALTVVAIAPSAALLVLEPQLAALPLTIAAIAIGVVAWMLLLIWLNHPIAQETAATLRARRQRRLRHAEFRSS